MDGNGGQQPAGGLGSVLTSMFVRGATDVRSRAAPIQQRVAETAFNAITNHVSDEVRQMMGWLFRTVADHPDTPTEVRTLFRNLGNHRGQAMAWIGGTATGAAMGGGLMNLLANAMNPVVLPLIAAEPHGVLTPGDAAQASVRGFTGPVPMAREAAYSGISGERFRVLEGLSETRPTLNELQALLNRGSIPASDATVYLRQQGYRQAVINDLLSLRTVDITPENAAAMWNRDIVSIEEGRRVAQRWGLSPRDFDRLTLLGGEPPSPMELLMAWRRGVLDEGDVDRGLVQGPLRKEWIPAIKALQWEPLSPGEAADSVNQGHLGLEAATREARLSGVRPEHFSLMIENAGLPPGIEFADEAYNRGLITDAQWTAMFLESRIKNRYIPLMKSMRTRLIPQETIRMLFREGVYTLEQAIDGMRGHGFSPTDARALMELEVARRNEGTKDLTRAQVVDLFEDDIIDGSEARQMLSTQGYSPEEVEWQILIAEVTKMRRFVNAAITRIRNAYVGGHIDEEEVNGRLSDLGLSAMRSNDLVAIWDIERETITAQLTPTQILAAAKKDIIDWNDAYQRLTRRGYDPLDAWILVTSNGGDLPRP